MKSNRILLYVWGVLCVSVLLYGMYLLGESPKESNILTAMMMTFIGFPSTLVVVVLGSAFSYVSQVIFGFGEPNPMAYMIIRWLLAGVAGTVQWFWLLPKVRAWFVKRGSARLNDKRL